MEGMLPAFIIEQIRRRERQEREQPRLELPLPVYPRPPVQPDEVDRDRGVVVIDLL